MAGEAEQRRILLHATAIAVAGRAALLLGSSGSGKSDLALRCLMHGVVDRGRAVQVALVADDQVIVQRDAGRLICRPPSAIAGLIEMRGLGIQAVPYVAEADVALVVRLTPDPIERLPEPRSHDLLGLAVPEIQLAPFEASAPFKLLFKLNRLA